MESCEKQGLIHLYCGNGKGKTTAAMGLALRALGRGLRVTVVQFLKDGTSGELRPLNMLGAKVLSGSGTGKFSWRLTEAERVQVLAEQNARLESALAESSDLLILDEACAACRTGLLDEELVRRAVYKKPKEQEVVLTGREPPEWLLERADYITKMECERHPFESGVAAREGIEF